MTISAPPQRADQVQSTQRSDRPLRGILLLMTSSVFLAASDTMAKYLASSLPVIEIAWIRFTVFVLIMFPIMLRTRPFILQSVSPLLQITRSVALVASSLLFIWGLRYLQIAEATAAGFISPLCVTALSVIFLGEAVGMRRWIATGVGLIGVLIVVRPGTSAFQIASLLPVASAMAWATTIVITRTISGHDRATTTMTYAALIGFGVLSLLVPFVWVPPTAWQVLVAAGIGITATAGHWVVVLAFRHADASVLAPFSYLHLLWVTIGGYMVFGDVPDGYTLVGATIIISSGIYTAHRERVRFVASRAAEASLKA